MEPEAKKPGGKVRGEILNVATRFLKETKGRSSMRQKVLGASQQKDKAKIRILAERVKLATKDFGARAKIKETSRRFSQTYTDQKLLSHESTRMHANSKY